MARTVHIIGAGVAGLSSAVELAEQGQAVVVHEAASNAGGRCRSYHDPALDMLIDNGNHLVLSGNHAVMRLLDMIGARNALHGPDTASFSFVDLADNTRWTLRMSEGKIEETFYPRNPLDVLAQQIVAIGAMEEVNVDDLYALVRRAAPFAELPRGSFEGVLDMLSGRYPSDEFAELRPRIVWDRIGGKVRAREGAKRVAVVNAGTIPDRGLYGVFLSGDESGKSRRVGELDEEMVFESRTGEVFLLGASSWRIDEITHDRVLVSPAPGEPGKMPFWHGDRPGRPPEFGRAIGELARTLTAAPRREAVRKLTEEHGLDRRAAANLRAYLDEQAEATGEVPSDRTIVVERYLDEVGDWRVCVLSPFGARVHAPWALAIEARMLIRACLEKSISRLSSLVPGTLVISAQIWSTTSVRRPSLKFGTHSTI